MSTPPPPPKARGPAEFEAGLAAAPQAVARFEAPQRGPMAALQHLLHGTPTLVPVIVLAFSIAVFALIAGERFLSPLNLSLILQQVTIIGILAAAQTLIVLTAGIDLSVAAIMVLMSVISGRLGVSFGVPAPIAILAGFVLGTAAGAFNGLLIARLKLPPFIVTLGTWNIFFALNLWLSGAQSIRSQDIDANAPLLKFFGTSFSVGGAMITYGSILLVVVFAVLWYVLNRTAWGRHVYAVGDDKQAAELAGIRTDRVLIQVYALAGFICGLAAWASIGRVGSISPQSFFEGNLQSITAVVIGGISLFGGRGSIMGALFGALIVGVFSLGLRMMGADAQWTYFMIGVLIIAAVAVDQWIRKAVA